jgi:hypothetical protein
MIVTTFIGIQASKIFGDGHNAASVANDPVSMPNEQFAPDN